MLSTVNKMRPTAFHPLILFGAAILFLIEACAQREQLLYTPDPVQLKEVQTKILEGSIETPTLGDPFIALKDHEAFMVSYFGEKSELTALSMHRLADLYLILEDRKYQEAITNYLQRLQLYQKGRLRKAPAAPLVAYTRSLRIYEKLLQDYPDRPENDRVLYQMARIYEATGRPERRDEMLKHLVEEHPESQYFAESQFRLADAYFAAGKFHEAAAAYQAAAQTGDFSILDHGRKGASERAEIAVAESLKRDDERRALYKTAWTKMALEDFRGAIDTFRTLLDRTRRTIGGKPLPLDSKILSAAEWEFVQEVLRGMVLAFSYWGPPTQLQAYFESAGHRDYEYLIYRKLGDLYLSQGLIYNAVKVYDTFLKAYPFHLEAPELSLGVIEAYQRLKLIDLSNKARIQFLDDFGEGSAWSKNTSAEGRAKVAPHLKKITYQLALFYHSEAQKTRRDKDYEKATQWYRRFLAAYPAETESSRVNFLLAEGLQELRKYEEAAAEYEKAAYQYPLHQDSAESGYAAILVMERIRSRRIKAGPDVKTPSLDLQLAQACIRFAKAFPTDERTVDVQLKAAELFFKSSYFNESRTLAEEITRSHLATRHPAALKAVRLIANSYFEQGDYEKAAEAYRQVSLNYASETEQEEVRKLWASALYKRAEELRKAGKLQEAEEAFYKVQREVPASDVAPVALYDAGLMAMDREDLKAAIGTFGLLVQQYPRASLNAKVPPLLLQAQQRFLDQNRYAEAQVIAEGIKNLGTGSDERLAYQAQRMIANRYFEASDFNRAAEVYRGLKLKDVSSAEQEEVKRLWAAALYKRAEEFKKEGKLREAEEAFYTVQRELPGSEVAPVALYDAGLLAMLRKDHKAALEAFGLLVERYPGASHAAHAALQMASIHEGAGRFKEAASEYQKVPTLTKDRGMAAQALLAAGWLYEQTGDWNQAEPLYQLYLEGYGGEFEKVAEIRFRVIQIKQRLGLHGQAKELLQAFIKQYGVGEEIPSKLRYHLAKAYLSSADYLQEDYKAVKLVPPLEDNLAQKRKLLANVLDLYIHAAEYKISEVATEATYKIGTAFEEFRTALLGSERPQGLTPQQLEQYNFLLEEQAYPFEEKAIAAYEGNVRRAQELGLYDPWIRQSFDDLARLVPGRYQKPELKEVLTRQLAFRP
jgi:TolA-binding protein